MPRNSLPHRHSFSGSTSTSLSAMIPMLVGELRCTDCFSLFGVLVAPPEREMVEARSPLFTEVVVNKDEARLGTSIMAAMTTQDHARSPRASSSQLER